MLGEFHVNAVRERPAARDEARAEVRDLTAWKPAIADAPVLEPGGKSRIAASFRIGCADRGCSHAFFLRLPAH
jgi:hypothetical protein